MEAHQQLSVLPIGTRVRLGLRNDSDAIDGRIIEVTIYADYSVTYKVEWWDGRDRQCEWMIPELFFLAGDVEPVLVGFAGPTEGNSG